MVTRIDGVDKRTGLERDWTRPDGILGKMAIRDAEMGVASNGGRLSTYDFESEDEEPEDAEQEIAWRARHLGRGVNL